MPMTTRAGKAGVARGLVSDVDSPKASKGQDLAAPDSLTIGGMM